MWSSSAARRTSSLVASGGHGRGAGAATVFPVRTGGPIAPCRRVGGFDVPLEDVGGALVGALVREALVLEPAPQAAPLDVVGMTPWRGHQEVPSSTTCRWTWPMNSSCFTTHLRAVFTDARYPDREIVNPWSVLQARGHSTGNQRLLKDLRVAGHHGVGGEPADHVIPARPR